MARARDEQSHAELRGKAATRDLAAATSALDTLGARVRTLEATLAGEQADARRVDSERAAAQLEVARLLDERLALREADARQHAALTASAATLTDRSDVLAALERAHGNLLAEHGRLAASAAELESRLAQTQARESNAQRSIEAKDRAHTDLARQLAGEGQINARQQVELVAHKAQLARCLEQLQTRECHRSIYETNLRELEAEFDVATARAAALETRANQLALMDVKLNTELAAQRATITGLESAAATREALLAVHSAALTEAQQERASLGGKLEAHARRVEDTKRDLEQERSAHTVAVASHVAERDALERARLELEARCTQIAREQGVSLARLSWLETALVAAVQRAESHAAAEAGVLEQARELEAAAAAHQSQAASAAAELAQDRAALTAMTATASGQQALLVEQGRHLTESHEAARLMAEERDEQMQLISALREQIDTLGARLAAPESERRALEERVASLTYELATKDAHAIRLEAMTAELRSAVSQLGQSLAERDAELQRMTRLAANSAYALGRVQSSIDDLGSLSAGVTDEREPGQASVLTRIDGGQNQSFVVRGRTTIGRDPDNDIHLQARFVSRRHAALIPGDRSAFVEDLRSTNGVIVNGRRVRCARLTHGDVVTFGVAEFRYTVASAPDSAVAIGSAARSSAYP